MIMDGHMSKNDWTSLKLSIRVIGPDINCDAIDELFGVKHTRFTKRGSKLSPSFPAARNDFWVFRVGEVEINEDLDLFRRCELFLNSKTEQFQYIRQTLGFRCEVYISHHSSLAQGGLDIDASFLSAMALSGVVLKLSLLMWGGIVDDSADPVWSQKKDELD